MFICALTFVDRIRGTVAGANNRMDLLALLTSGIDDNEVTGPEEDILGIVGGWEEDETHNPDIPAISHKRGLTPFVFVPFEEVKTFFFLVFILFFIYSLKGFLLFLGCVITFTKLLICKINHHDTLQTS